MNLQFKSKEALIDALNARRKWAVALDAKNSAQHMRAEAAFLGAFRKACSAASKWSYKTAKDHFFQLDFRKHDRPQCPEPLAPMIDRFIETIQRDGRTRYTITSDGTFHRIHHLLTHDEKAKPTVCD